MSEEIPASVPVPTILKGVVKELRAQDYVECSCDPVEMLARGYAQSKAIRERVAQKLEQLIAVDDE